MSTSCQGPCRLENGECVDCGAVPDFEDYIAPWPPPGAKTITLPQVAMMGPCSECEKLRELLKEALAMAPNARQGVIPGRTNGERAAYGKMQAALDEGT